MDIFHINDNQVLLNPDSAVTPQGFLWLDATHDEVSNNAEAWRAEVERITCIHIYDLHLSDAVNLSHPSYFDNTHDYEMVVFRKLALNGEAVATDTTEKRKIPAALNKLLTVPVSFFLFGHALVTVRAANSKTIDNARARLLNYKAKADGSSHGRLPASPEDLMLRLLNAMVDQYLELRQPLTQQLDRWQHALLDPRRPFNNWMALLDSRLELRKLDNLCEEQRDALQELRDHIVDTHDGNNDAQSRAKDLLLVRTTDVMEHISRVLNHARRLEASLESAVQIHFSAMAHRTSEIMRTLTVITALFMPLTLITGIFGMNFEIMPLLKNASGFWITMGAMGFIVVLLLIYFRSQRYLEDRLRNSRR
ncbi:MAG: magnesium transporter CorA family protein [Burkholderiaceae bacterium]|nr:magnesium transporter CorA family protein [Burkholderiaceae bacterium]